MKLRELLREDFTKYIRNKIIKEQCESCGGNKDLHLHHMTTFDDILKDTLKELNLLEQDSEHYSIDELNSIKDIMLVKQIKCSYKTLCKKCHKSHHFKKTMNELIEESKVKYPIYHMFMYNKIHKESIEVFKRLEEEYYNNYISLNDMQEEILQLTNKYYKEFIEIYKKLQ